MALYGTHLRFAEDVKKDFDVTEENKYFSGTIYPDSRYYTKIDRNLTHDTKYLEKSFYINDDFKKGWAVHLLYDNLQFVVINNLFSDLFDDQGHEESSNNWFTRTALKILQDINDVEYCDITFLIKHVRYAEAPNHEDIQLIEKYNSMVIEIYSQPLPLTINDYKQTWLPMGMSTEIIDRLKDTVATLQKDSLVMEKIASLYAHTLAVYKRLNQESAA